MNRHFLKNRAAYAKYHQNMAKMKKRYLDKRTGKT